MTVLRRRVLKTFGLAGAFYRPAGAQDSAVSTDTLRHVSNFYGTNLSVDRLQVVKPVLERRGAQTRALRDFEVDDSVGPVQGPLTR